MPSSGRPKIVILGMMSKHPVAGVVWQTIHYLIGFERLGYEAYYVEAGAHQPSLMLLRDPSATDVTHAAVELIDGVMRRFDLGNRWAFHALHADGQCFGMSESELKRLYREAALIVNLHGGTEPLPEHSATGRLIYLETDPVALQLELAEHLQSTIDFLTPHEAFFTFAENYGQPGCALPVSSRFTFKTTRQPVVIGFWEAYGNGQGTAYTTIGNWRQWRDVTFDGQVYHWSKHLEFMRFLDVPTRTRLRFELSLSRCDAEDRELLERHGWIVRDALSFSLDLDAYRCRIASSRGEFTVAKDQNVRLRTGWFSDRSATYLAAGRPVITQETGFSSVLPTGEGLFAFSTRADVELALGTVEADYPHHARAALEVAREYFAHDVVLPALLEEVGL
jgi:hypothetical protein